MTEADEQNLRRPCRPCPMCTGAIARSGPKGPALFDEARLPIDGYCS